MGEKIFRGLHYLAVFCVVQYLAVRFYTFVYLDVPPSLVDYVMWALIAHIAIFEPLQKWFDRKRAFIASTLEYQIPELVVRLGFRGMPIYEDVQAMFVRHARELGESEESGWAGTLDTILFRLNHRWGRVPSDGVILHTSLQVAGIHYTLDESDQFDLELSRVMERYVSPTPDGVNAIRHRFLCAQRYLTSALMRLGELNERLEAAGSKSVEVAPSDFALAVELYCMGPEVTDITWRWFLDETRNDEKAVGVGDLFQVMQQSRALGIDPRSLRRYLGHHGCFSFVFLRDLITLKAVDRWVLQELTERPGTFTGLYQDEVEMLVRRWQGLDRPCTLAHFRQFPNDAAYLEDVRLREEAAERSTLEAAERRDREEQARKEKAEASAPKGRKRGQASAPTPAPVEFDLQALCKALVVPDHFASLNQDILRAIAVMGLLAVGDRLPAWHKRPSRNRGKLWRQVRSTATELDHPRRVVDETVAALLREKVVEHVGGDYRLKDPTDALKHRHPNSHALVTNARGLIKRAKSLAS